MKTESLAEREAFLDLYEVYGSLLTEMQKAIFEDRYAYDLSLSEIAENRAISKAAVSDSLHVSEGKLLEYEEKLGVLRKKREIAAILGKIENEEDEEKRKALVNEAKEMNDNGI